MSTTPTRPTHHQPDPAGLLAAALAYAARGWHVIPLVPGGKRPAFPDHTATSCTMSDPRCAKAGVHLGWEQRATTDPDRIARAWTARHGFGVGIACGPSGLVVLDLDTPKPDTPPLPTEWAGPGIVDGADILCLLAERAGHPVPLDTYTVNTPTGGTHLYFTAPTGGPALTNTAGTLAPLVDTRAAGGQVVAPPTAGPACCYRVTLDVPVAPLPDWLTDALRPTPQPAPGTVSVTLTASRGGARESRAAGYARAAVAAEAARVRQAEAGRRNQALFTAAIALGQLVAGGVLAADDVRALLIEAAAGHLTAGAYTPHQAHTTITSGLARGATRPRRLDLPGRAA